jgi:hypothetical protein
MLPGVSRDELDLDDLPAEPVVPGDPRRAVLWAAGIGVCAVFVLFLLLTSDLIFGRTVRLAAPPGFGRWTADADLAAALAGWVQADQERLGVKRFSAAYATEDGARLLLWGGTGSEVESAADATLLETLRIQTLQLVSSAPDGRTLGADPGRHRGRATCTEADQEGARYAVCAWTQGEAALGILLVDIPAADVGGTLREALDAVVVLK